MTPMQAQGNAVLNALSEGAFTAILTAYNQGYILRDISPRVDLKNILTELKLMKDDEVEYWLNQFSIVD